MGQRIAGMLNEDLDFFNVPYRVPAAQNIVMI